VNTRRVSDLLLALAAAETMVPAQLDRQVLREAAVILRDPNRLYNTHGEPEVVVVRGPDADPIAEDVGRLGDQFRDLADEMHAWHDHLDDLRRLLGKRTTTPPRSPRG
jgi:hypothetical protein